MRKLKQLAPYDRKPRAQVELWYAKGVRMRLLQPTKAETIQIRLGLFKNEAGFFATDIYYPDALHDSNGKGGWVFFFFHRLLSSCTHEQNYSYNRIDFFLSNWACHPNCSSNSASTTLDDTFTTLQSRWEEPNPTPRLMLRRPLQRTQSSKKLGSRL